MKISGPSGLAKPRWGVLPPTIQLIAGSWTKTFGIVHILVASTCDMRLSGFRCGQKQIIPPQGRDFRF
jgi:hypothetical protein